MATVNNADLSAGLNIGDIVECTVEQVMPYGAFVRIASNGRKGMIHISELSYSFVKDINEFLKVQDKINAKVVKIDDRGRIDLSIKQTTEPPAPQQPQKFSNSAPRFSRPPQPINHEGRENFKPRPPREHNFNNNNREFREVRNFHEMQETYRENNPEEADSFEKKMASFLKTSEAKITDLNTRNSARSGRSTRRRNNNRDY